MERKYYLDNLRWMAILLLFPFHAAQIWNSGYYIWSHTNQFLYAFSTAVYPWFITLLFVIAGMSAKYSLAKLNFHNKVSRYFTTASFPVYILHYVWVVVSGYFILKCMKGTALQFIATAILSFILTMASYEIIKRIPGVRTLFGIGKQKKEVML